MDLTNTASTKKGNSDHRFSLSNSGQQMRAKQIQRQLAQGREFLSRL
jgi:hypothetical protein